MPRSMPDQHQLRRAVTALAGLIARYPNTPWVDLAHAAHDLEEEEEPTPGPLGPTPKTIRESRERRAELLRRHPEARSKRVRTALATVVRAKFALMWREMEENGALFAAVFEAGNAPDEEDEQPGVLLEALAGAQARVAALRAATRVIRERTRVRAKVRSRRAG